MTERKQEQMKRYLNRSNNIPMAILGWKSPNRMRRELGGLPSLGAPFRSAPPSLTPQGG